MGLKVEGLHHVCTVPCGQEDSPPGIVEVEFLVQAEPVIHLFSLSRQINHSAKKGSPGGRTLHACDSVPIKDSSSYILQAHFWAHVCSIS